MKVTLLGTRGSVGRAGSGTLRYGGDTSAVEVVSDRGERVVLDAGSGLLHLKPDGRAEGRIDVLLTHLHMDHIQGLGFFGPLRTDAIETHLWGPVSTTMGLADRLARYLSPPLFPVRLRDMRSTHLHDIGPGAFTIGSLTVTADLICHPGPTLGFRIEEEGRSLVYMPDHEPALGHRSFPGDPQWTSGFDLARGADVLLHDSQYTDEEYERRVGWGHSTLGHAVALARAAGVSRLVTFHHDPEHSDEMLDHMLEQSASEAGDLVVEPGVAGAVLEP